MERPDKSSRRTSDQPAAGRPADTVRPCGCSLLADGEHFSTCEAGELVSGVLTCSSVSAATRCDTPARLRLRLSALKTPIKCSTTLFNIQSRAAFLVTQCTTSGSGVTDSRAKNPPIAKRGTDKAKPKPRRPRTAAFLQTTRQAVRRCRIMKHWSLQHRARTT